MLGVWRAFLSDLRNEAREPLAARGSALSYGIAAHLLSSSGRSILVAPSEESARDVYDSVTAVLGGSDRLLHLPNLLEEPYGPLSPHPSAVAERAEVLTRAAFSETCSIVLSPFSLLWKVPGAGFWKRHAVVIEKERSYELQDLKRTLWAMGYRREDLVEGPGEYSIRGSLLDIFPPFLDLGLRVEFFGDQVEQVRFFDPVTQRSLSGTEDSFMLGPLSEVVRSDEALEGLGKKLEESGEFGEMRLEQLERSGGYPTLCVEARSSGDIFVPLPLFMGDAPLFPLSGAVRAFFETLRSRLDAEFAGSGRPRFLEPAKLFPREKDLEGLLPGGPDDDDPLPVERFNLLPSRVSENLDSLIARVREGYRVIVAFASEGSLERVRDFARERGVEPVTGDTSPGAFAPALYFVTCRSAESLRFPTIMWATVSEKDLLGRGTVQPARPSRNRELFFEGLRDLKAGDFVVHVDHGICAYKGIETIRRGDRQEDFLHLAYAGGDKLLLPMSRMDLIQKYKGPEGFAPQLDKLGTTAFKKRKERAQKAVREVADELLKIYAKRRTSEGRPAFGDRHLEEEFSKLFPFDLTHDQKKALEDVEKDMESGVPMDRVICGDVGFGKTEVAMRAAFKMVNSGRQVAVLCPTTVLCLQHYENFTERFSLFPVKIEMLSRFVPPGEQKEVLKGLASGTTDIVIGTHRVLSRDVDIPSLGLLIVDEEQRFGVMHKERIKDFKADIDVLTLTATPIPRTLQMGLSTILDMSLIETPPKDRLAIDTLLSPYDEELVTSAIRNELRREGQAFYLHNRVEDIDKKAARLRELVPEARFIVAHGQLAEKELEKRMIAFYRHEADVLVTTTIIENGVDIPRANTLIVDNAHNFGLTQLYQIRGRIGRSNVPAYAYLLIPRRSEISADAVERLRTLEEFTELGSGFRIAAIDLELRGAGNLLGREQSGNIEAVGFELYMRLLEEAVSEMKGEPSRPAFRTEMQMSTDMAIPRAYIENDDQRLSIYRELSLAREVAEVDRIEQEVTDRYGSLPAQVLNLLRGTRLRLKAERFLAARIVEAERGVTVDFGEHSPVDVESLLSFVSARRNASMKGDHAVYFPLAAGETGLDLVDSLFSTVRLSGKKED